MVAITGRGSWGFVGIVSIFGSAGSGLIIMQALRGWRSGLYHRLALHLQVMLWF
jgi:hypothetical protein